jgi:hypothetical protein
MFSREERVAESSVTDVRSQSTLWSTVFLERLASAQQVKKFFTSYGNRILLNVFTKAVTGLYPVSPLSR